MSELVWDCVSLIRGSLARVDWLHGVEQDSIFCMLQLFKMSHTRGRLASAALSFLKLVVQWLRLRLCQSHLVKSSYCWSSACCGENFDQFHGAIIWIDPSKRMTCKRRILLSPASCWVISFEITRFNKSWSLACCGAAFDQLHGSNIQNELCKRLACKSSNLLSPVLRGASFAYGRLIRGGLTRVGR